MVTRLVASAIVRRMTTISKSSVCERYAAFRPSGGWMDQIFTLHQLLEIRHTPGRLEHKTVNREQ